MSSYQVTAYITALANALACHFDLAELAFLASVFVQLGDTLATIVAQRTMCNSATENKNEKMC